MYCPKCGTENTNGNGICQSCGFAFQNEVLSQAPDSTPNQDVPQTLQIPIPKIESISKKKFLGIAMWIVAVLVIILAFSAASSISSGGIDISCIRSVGGKTLDEAYYHNLGAIYKGYAGIIRAFGIFMASILAYFGFNSYNDGE